MNNNVICWFEIYVDDFDRAKKFYTDVLGTQFEDVPAEGEDFKMAFFSSDGDENSVSGALVQMAGTRECSASKVSTMVYFPTYDCVTEEAKVEVAGGKVITPKMSIGEHGFCSICEDSEGNQFGLYSMK